MPTWKKDFPVRQSEEHKASRREFGKFLCGAVVAGAGVTAAGRMIANSKTVADAPPVFVAKADEVPVGGSRLFHYPRPHEPAILVHLASGEFAAYSQSCTHLMCPVHFKAETAQLVCPCHEGYFSAQDGSVISGPPQRALPSFAVERRGDELWVGPSVSASPSDDIV